MARAGAVADSLSSIKFVARATASLRRRHSVGRNGNRHFRRAGPAGCDPKECVDARLNDCKLSGCLKISLNLRQSAFSSGFQRRFTLIFLTQILLSNLCLVPAKPRLRSTDNGERTSLESRASMTIT
jgi:hypothetical protein